MEIYIGELDALGPLSLKQLREGGVCPVEETWSSKILRS